MDKELIIEKSKINSKNCMTKSKTELQTLATSLDIKFAKKTTKEQQQKQQTTKKTETKQKKQTSWARSTSASKSGPGFKTALGGGKNSFWV